MNKPAFDPSQPFEAVDSGKPPFDPNQPFQAADQPQQSQPSVGQNAWSDIKGQASNMWDTGKKMMGALTPTNPVTLAQSAMQASRGTPLMQTDVGKSIANVPKIPGQLLNRASEIVNDPVGAFKRHPVNTALDVASVAAPILGKVAPALGLAEDPPLNFLSKTAQDTGVDALGYGKGALKTPQNIARARQTAQTMYDNGVLTPLASHEEMASRAGQMADTAGKAIGAHLDKIGASGAFMPVDDLTNELNSLRPHSETGQPLQGGAHDAIHAKIDRAVETAKAYSPDTPSDVATGARSPNTMSFADANKLKGTLQDLANFKSNKEATLLDRIIAGKTREVIDRNLENVSGQMGDAQGHADFLANKQKYSAAMQAQDPLYNRISSHLANNKLSLTDFILAAPELAAGNPMRAVGLMGGKRLLQNFGPQTVGSVLNKAAKAPTSMFANAPATARAASYQPPDNKIDLGNVATQAKVLTKDVARKFLDMFNGNFDQAKAYAKSKGFTWKTKKP
jgi:hypothetical protein